NEAETRFLTNLRTTLRLSDASVAKGAQTAGTLASAPVAGAPLGDAAASTEDTILQTSILAAALELLPQSLATVAVIPLQLRLVYQIGQKYGQKLDANQAKDLLATFGIGAATQVLDGVARRVLSGVAQGVLGRLLGGLAGGVAGAAAGAGTVFAATYALGHAADQYYAQGRTLSTADLQALFAKLRDQAQELYPKVQAQIQERARTLDLSQLAATLTPGGARRSAHVRRASGCFAPRRAGCRDAGAGRRGRRGPGPAFRRDGSRACGARALPPRHRGRDRRVLGPAHASDGRPGRTVGDRP